MKIQQQQQHTHNNNNNNNNKTKNKILKLYKSKEGKTITTFYTFCVKLSDEREKNKKPKKNKKYNEVFKVA